MKHLLQFLLTLFFLTRASFALFVARRGEQKQIFWSATPSTCTLIINDTPFSHTRCNASFRRRQTKLLLSGGFGGGFASKSNNNTGGKSSQKTPSSSSKKMNPRDAKRAQEKLLERYGGDVGKGTQQRILSSLESLEPHLQEAAALYKSIMQFDALVAPMTDADRNRLIPPVQSQMVENDREKLQIITREHNLSEREIHNLYQRITWDASADAKATQADIVGNTMKPELQERITKACKIAVEATQAELSLGKVLDVGCGHGAIVKSLVDAGLSEPDMYVGIDLSPVMVNNAIERYGFARNGRTGNGRQFVAGDFLAHDFGDTGIFDSVIFCSCLHDLPDMESSISRAASLLRTNGGKLIIVHAQGAQHVLMQHQANPVMVKRGLPTAKEWVVMLDDHNDWGLKMEHEPADSRTDRESKEGYLAVLSKV